MNGITDAQRSVLATLAPVVDGATYLAGGVAVAVELHHRTSLDLDLFVSREFDAERVVERMAVDVPDLRIVGVAPGTIHAEVATVPVSILSYRYASLAPPRIVDGLALPVASLDDLACMKVSAIAGRGAAKDFWDLFALLRAGVGGGDLREVLRLYERKFPVDDPGHAIRSLAYFGDADAAPLPRGLSSAQWDEIKRDIAARVREL